MIEREAKREAKTSRPSPWAAAECDIERSRRSDRGPVVSCHEAKHDPDDPDFDKSQK